MQIVQLPGVDSCCEKYPNSVPFVCCRRSTTAGGRSSTARTRCGIWPKWWGVSSWIPLLFGSKCNIERTLRWLKGKKKVLTSSGRFYCFTCLLPPTDPRDEHRRGHRSTGVQRQKRSQDHERGSKLPDEWRYSHKWGMIPPDSFVFMCVRIWLSVQVLLEAQEMAVKNHNVEYKSNLYVGECAALISYSLGKNLILQYLITWSRYMASGF